MKKLIGLILMMGYFGASSVWAQSMASSASNTLKLEEQVEFKSWPNCIRLSNNEIELIITTDIGPRILRFGFIGGPNIFYISPADTGKTGGVEWHLYGGHRFWLAPEIFPRTYYPDNTPVSYTWDGETLKLTQDIEPETQTVKEIEIRMDPGKNEIEVLHRLINEGSSAVELAPWAISACAPGGRAIIPQEPYIDPADFLLPARPLVLWAFTKMNDPRYVWGEKFIQAKQDPKLLSETKIGVLNKQEWAAYIMDEYLFCKIFKYDPEVLYPDYGCNNEVYMNGDFLEVESLGPLIKIAPQGTIEHHEKWLLYQIEAINSDDEEKINQVIEPLLKLSLDP
jgi:hypothetical protein